MNTTAVDTSIVKHEIPNPRDKDQKKEFYTIEPSSHPDFPIDFAIASITTKELADLINSFFKPALTDYAGCRIGVVVGPGRVYYADSVVGPDVINTAISKLGLKPGTYFVELCFRDNDPGREGTIKTLKATNFVAKNEVFRNFVKDVAMHIAAVNPLYISKEDVPAEDIEKERAVLRAQALNEGKPEKIVDKMVEGRIAKFYENYCLLEQPFVKDNDKKVVDILNGLIATIGEKITVRRFVRYEKGEGLAKKEENFAEEVQKQLQ